MGFVVDKVATGQVFPRVLRFSPVNFIPLVLHYLEKRKKNYSSSSQVCTISLKAAVRGPSPQKNARFEVRGIFSIKLNLNVFRRNL
jgi:hypothetical protein